MLTSQQAITNRHEKKKKINTAHYSHLHAVNRIRLRCISAALKTGGEMRSRCYILLLLLLWLLVSLSCCYLMHARTIGHNVISSPPESSEAMNVRPPRNPLKIVLRYLIHAKCWLIIIVFGLHKKRFVDKSFFSRYNDRQTRVEIS